MEKTYYDLLAISRFSTRVQIKGAYERKHAQLIAQVEAGKQDAYVELAQIEAAYAVLSDLSKRWQYDTDTFRTPTPSTGKSPGVLPRPDNRYPDSTVQEEGGVQADIIDEADRVSASDESEIGDEEGQFSSNMEEYVRGSQKPAHQQRKPNQPSHKSQRPGSVKTTASSPPRTSLPLPDSDLHADHGHKKRRKTGAIKRWLIILVALVGGFYVFDYALNYHNTAPPVPAERAHDIQTRISSEARARVTPNVVPADVQPPSPPASKSLRKGIIEPTPMFAVPLATVPLRASVVDVALHAPVINQTMDLLYGRRTSSKPTACWQASLTDQGEREWYCMLPLGASLVTVGESEHLYIQMSGCWKKGSRRVVEMVDDGKEFCGIHPQLGGFGAAVVDLKTSHIQAFTPVLTFPQGFGRGPYEPLLLVQLSADGKVGWLGEGSFMGQGNEFFDTVLYTPQGGVIVNVIGNIPGTEITYDYLTDVEKEILYTYTFERSDLVSPYYPIVIERTVSETEKNGSKVLLSHQTFKAQFDPQTFSYQCSSEFCKKE